MHCAAWTVLQYEQRAGGARKTSAANQNNGERMKRSLSLVLLIAVLASVALASFPSVAVTHGYLSGEQFTCPICGEEAEVYSRITGYYRPVKNWNAGKAQEYRNRTEYKPEKFMNRFSIGAGCCNTGATDEITQQLDKNTEPLVINDGASGTDISADGLYLFTTKTCPNCRLAKQYLEGREYTVIDAEEEPDLARKYGIMSAPTLVVQSGGTVTKYTNASNIKKYVDTVLV